MTTIGAALSQANVSLSASSTPQLDSAILLSHVLEKSRAFLMANAEINLTPAQETQFSVLLQRRINGEPMAYILGHREFWSLDLLVSTATLIPRPETELLVELILATVGAVPVLNVADLGTGSGAIALALATERPHWQIVATDKDERALKIAQQNAQRLRLANVSFYEGDWYLALPTHQRFQVLVSNPPYIAEQDIHLKQGDVRFEPSHALVAGPAGLDALAHLIGQGAQWLEPKGWLFLEHGYNQGAAVRSLLLQTGHFDNIQLFLDYAGNERVTIAQNSSIIGRQ